MIRPLVTGLFILWGFAPRSLRSRPTWEARAPGEKRSTRWKGALERQLSRSISRKTALVACAALVACSSRATPAKSGGFDAAFTTEEQKILACLDLRDHIVDLYATDYVAREGTDLTAAQRVAFRDGWAEQLAKRGTFERFEQSCFSGLTPRKYRCGMQSQTTGGLAACMRLTER